MTQQDETSTKLDDAVALNGARGGDEAITFRTVLDTVTSESDLARLLDQLVVAAAALPGVRGTGITVSENGRRLSVVAASEDSVRQLELIQVRTQRGPMPDALRAGAAVTSRELATEGLRWPEFAAAATMSGFMSVAAVPMIAARQTVGAIDFFGADDALIAGDNRQGIATFAKLAAVGVLHEQLTARADQLQHALTSRVIIEQAKGIIAGRHDVGMQQSFDALRRHARDHNTKIGDVAAAVVNGDYDILPRRPGGR